MPEIESHMTLYDFAKATVANQKKISEESYERCLNKISKTIYQECDFLLLMCPDLHQFVFFSKEAIVPTETIRKDIEEVLNNRGEIMDIDMSNHGKRVWEFWIKDKYDGQIYLYQLSDYTNETVIFGEGEK